jgi:hypothetical protein
MFYCNENILVSRRIHPNKDHNIVTIPTKLIFHCTDNILVSRRIPLNKDHNIMSAFTEPIIHAFHNIVAISGGKALFSTIYIRATSKFTGEYISAGIRWTHALRAIVLFRVPNCIGYF